MYGLPYVPYLDLHERAVAYSMPFEEYMDGVLSGQIEVELHEAPQAPPQDWRKFDGFEEHEKAASGNCCEWLVRGLDYLCCISCVGCYEDE